MATTDPKLDRLTAEEAAETSGIIAASGTDAARHELGIYTDLTLWKAAARERVARQTAMVIRARLAMIRMGMHR